MRGEAEFFALDAMPLTAKLGIDSHEFGLDLLLEIAPLLKIEGAPLVAVSFLDQFFKTDDMRGHSSWHLAPYPARRVRTDRALIAHTRRSRKRIVHGVALKHLQRPRNAGCSPQNTVATTKVGLSPHDRRAFIVLSFGFTNERRTEADRGKKLFCF